MKRHISSFSNKNIRQFKEKQKTYNTHIGYINNLNKE